MALFFRNIAGIFILALHAHGAYAQADVATSSLPGSSLDSGWIACGPIDDECKRRLLVRENISVEQCKDFIEPDNCIEQLAFARNDASICEHSDILRNNCYHYLATTHFTPELCERISVDAYKEECQVLAHYENLGKK